MAVPMPPEPLDYQPPPEESSATPCPHCGGPLIRGNLLTRTGIRFVPDYMKNVLMSDAGVRVTAFACRDCGMLTLAIAPDRMLRLNQLITPTGISRGCGRAAGRLWRWMGGRP